MEKRFDIKPDYYFRSSLAQAYTGDRFTGRQARRWLAHEIDSYPGLREHLAEFGYDPKQRIFTRAQLMILFETIGPP